MFFPASATERDPEDPRCKKMRKGFCDAVDRLPKRAPRAGHSGVRVIRPAVPAAAVAAAAEVDAASRGAPAPALAVEDAAQDTTDADSEVSQGEGSADSDGSGDGGRPPLPPPPPVARPQPPANEAVAANAADRVLPPGVNRDWLHWKVGGYGYIVYDAARDSLGAHCTDPRHGLCRANKVCKRLGLGYLMAWLMQAHDPEQSDMLTDRAAHKGTQGRLCSPLGFDARKKGRKWLVDRAATFERLLDLERAHHRGGSFDEPFTVAH